MRLAEHVFAPHYASPLPLPLRRMATLTDEAGAPLVELSDGDLFEALEFAGERAWGIAVARRLVGYLPLDAVAPA